MLSPLFWAEPAATEYKNHRIWPLQFRELPALGSVVGKLIIGENSAWDNIISHLHNFSVCECVCFSDLCRDLPKRKWSKAQKRVDCKHELIFSLSVIPRPCTEGMLVPHLGTYRDEFVKTVRHPSRPACHGGCKA